MWGTLALDGGDGGRWAHCGVERSGAVRCCPARTLRGEKRCSLLRGCMAGGASDEVEPVVQTSSSARAVNEGRERGQRPDAARRGAAGRSARCVESPIALVR